MCTCIYRSKQFKRQSILGEPWCKTSSFLDRFIQLIVSIAKQITIHTIESRKKERKKSDFESK